MNGDRPLPERLQGAACLCRETEDNAPRRLTVSAKTALQPMRNPPPQTVRDLKGI